MTRGLANWQAAHLASDLHGTRHVIWRAVWHGALGFVFVAAAHGAMAGSLNYCQGQTEPSAATQDRLVQVAAVVPAQLPPVQANEVAAGLQLAVRTELPFFLTWDGAALKVHCGELAT